MSFHAFSEQCIVGDLDLHWLSHNSVGLQKLWPGVEFTSSDS